MQSHVPKKQSDKNERKRGTEERVSEIEKNETKYVRTKGKAERSKERERRRKNTKGEDSKLTFQRG
jgi:hypothetical protein